jgi:hypothetical protein
LTVVVVTGTVVVVTGTVVGVTGATVVVVAGTAAVVVGVSVLPIAEPARSAAEDDPAPSDAIPATETTAMRASSNAYSIRDAPRSCLTLIERWWPDSRLRSMGLMNQHQPLVRHTFRELTESANRLGLSRHFANSSSKCPPPHHLCQWSGLRLTQHEASVTHPTPVRGGAGVGPAALSEPPSGGKAALPKGYA